MTARAGGGGGSPDRWPGVKSLCAVCGTQEHKHFRPGARPGGIGFPAGRIGDRGDREIVYVPNVYVPFPAPNGPRTPISWKRGFRVQKTPISPRPGKGSFLSKKSPIFYKENWDFWQKTPFSRSCEPGTLFFRKWGFGALSGVGVNFQKMREKRNWKNDFSPFFQNQTNADEFGRNPKIKPLVFRSMIFCASGFGRFFRNYPRISENWGKLQKIADEFRGFFICLLLIYFPDKDMTLQILVGRGRQKNGT